MRWRVGDRRLLASRFSSRSITSAWPFFAIRPCHLLTSYQSERTTKLSEVIGDRRSLEREREVIQLFTHSPHPFGFSGGKRVTSMYTKKRVSGHMYCFMPSMKTPEAPQLPWISAFLPSIIKLIKQYIMNHHLIISSLRRRWALSAPDFKLPSNDSPPLE